MGLYLAVPLGLLALFIAATGVAAVRRGWVLPMHRGFVCRVRLYGWGLLLLAFGLCVQAVFEGLDEAPAIWHWGADAGVALALGGLCTMGLSQRSAHDGRQETTTF